MDMRTTVFFIASLNLCALTGWSQAPEALKAESEPAFGMALQGRPAVSAAQAPKVGKSAPVAVKDENGKTADQDWDFGEAQDLFAASHPEPIPAYFQGQWRLVAEVGDRLKGRYNSSGIKSGLVNVDFYPSLSIIRRQSHPFSKYPLTVSSIQDKKDRPTDSVLAFISEDKLLFSRYSAVLIDNDHLLLYFKTNDNEQVYLGYERVKPAENKQAEKE